MLKDIMSLLRLLSTIQGRVVSGIALISSIVVGLWPDHPRPLDPEKASAIIMASLVWLYAEISSSKQINTRDIQLFESVRQHIPDDLMHFLRNHHFGTPYEKSKLNGLFVVRSWKSSRYSFHDSELQRSWIECLAKSDQFLDIIAANSFSLPNSAEMVSFYNDINLSDMPSRKEMDAIVIANDRAIELVRALDEFELLASKRLDVKLLLD